jgi:hypothetical protein
MSKLSDFTRYYTRADQPAKLRIIAGSCGEVGTGKTSFWLGAPGPIIVLSFDRGLEGVIEGFQDTKEIYVKEFSWVTAPGAEPDQSAAVDLRDEFTEVFEHAVTHARTVVLDKETDMWGVFKYAEFGAPEKGRPDDWDMLKNRVRRLMNMPKSLDINFGVIQGMKNEWISEVNPKTGKKGITQSGRRLPSGMDDIEAIMHINIEHLLVDGEFQMRVGKARGPGGRDIQNQTIPAVTFGEFAQLVFPESEESDWV